MKDTCDLSGSLTEFLLQQPCIPYSIFRNTVTKFNKDCVRIQFPFTWRDIVLNVFRIDQPPSELMAAALVSYSCNFLINFFILIVQYIVPA